MFVFRLLDRQGEWIRRTFTPQNQIRFGVVLIWVGIWLHVWVAFTDEPPLIGQMSAFAILVGGFGFVVTAVLAKNTEETSDSVASLDDGVE
jgi:hypothetical protein